MRLPVQPTGVEARRADSRAASFVLAAALVVGALAIAGCGGAPGGGLLAPALNGTERDDVSGGIRRGEVRPVMPRIQRLFARSDASAFTLVAQYDGIGSGSLPPFSPYAPGGWCFQLFIDVDGDATGYSPAGHDYVLRSMEIDEQGRAPLRRTLGGPPNQWGEAVALVAAGPSSRQLTIAVPLEHLGPDDGELEFVLEFYETVAGEDGVSHIFAANFEGTSTTGMEPRPLVAHRHGAVAPRGLPESPGRATVLHRR